MDDLAGCLVVIAIIFVSIQFTIGIIHNFLEIIFGFISTYSILFYGLGGFLIVYGLFVQTTELRQLKVKKEQIDQLSKTLNAQWQDWEAKS